jgi:hypothetical protein
MYGLTRATITLLAAGIAGFLIWIAARINDHSTGGYWLDYGLIAAAGLVMALSQLLGGWTKWGWPRLSVNVFLWAFVPVAVVVLWVVIFHQPHNNWFRHHIRSWSGDIHIRHLVNDFREYQSVLAFGLGLVFGFAFDTTGPVTERPVRRGRRRGAAPGAGRGAVAGDSGRAAPPAREPADRGERGTPAEPRPEPTPREGPPPGEQ